MRQRTLDNGYKVVIDICQVYAKGVPIKCAYAVIVNSKHRPVSNQYTYWRLCDCEAKFHKLVKKYSKY
jgi:hypothetical protein